MKDLDFDELDRAVSSLMSNVPKTAPQADDDKVKTLDIAPTLDGDDTPSFSKVEEAAAKVADDVSGMPVPTPPIPDTKAEVTTPEPVVTVPTPAPAARRGGRFMDVVHPSADMKKPDSPRPVSRSAATIEPLNASAQKIADVVPQKKEAEEKVAPVTAPVEMPTPEPEKTVIPEPAAVPSEEPKISEEPSESSSSTSDWPDPLDVAVPEEAKKEEVTSPEVVVEETPDTLAPLTSPFLPDAKVEKRPLGGIAPEEDDLPVEEPSPAPAAETDEVKKTVNDPNDQLPADPTEVEAHLPEELRGDVMAIEADTTHADMKQVAEKMPEIVPSAAKPVAAPTAVKPADEEPATSGPTSIPQQYREEPSTGDADSGSIYDTDSYHQPLAHPAKKKSEWMWVIWIVAVLLLGAAAGAAIFLLKLV
jgi:hypothetical protein